MSRKSHPDQGDLFHQPVYPSRMADQNIELTEALGQDSFSLATLNAYTAESNETHDISVVRLKAFVRATGANWLWDLIVADDGLTMLVGDEARLAEIALVQQERAALDDRLRQLKATPVHIVRRQR